MQMGWVPFRVVLRPGLVGHCCVEDMANVQLEPGSFSFLGTRLVPPRLLPNQGSGTAFLLPVERTVFVLPSLGQLHQALPKVL